MMPFSRFIGTVSHRHPTSGGNLFGLPILFSGNNVNTIVPPAILPRFGMELGTGSGGGAPFTGLQARNGGNPQDINRNFGYGYQITPTVNDFADSGNSYGRLSLLGVREVGAQQWYGPQEQYTGTLTSGSNIVTISTTFLAAGMGVSGTGIQAGTTISALGTGQITLSLPATASGSQTLTFDRQITSSKLDRAQYLASPANTPGLIPARPDHSDGWYTIAYRINSWPANLCVTGTGAAAGITLAELAYQGLGLGVNGPLHIKANDINGVPKIQMYYATGWAQGVSPAYQFNSVSGFGWPGGTIPNVDILPAGQVTLGVWHEFIIYVHWSTVAADGELRVWHRERGQPTFTETLHVQPGAAATLQYNGNPTTVDPSTYVDAGYEIITAYRAMQLTPGAVSPAWDLEFDAFDNSPTSFSDAVARFPSVNVAPPTTLNTVNQVLYAMEPPSESNAHGELTGNSLVPALSWNIPPPGTGLIEMWGQVYADASNLYPANVRAAVTNCETYYWSNSQSKWIRAQAVQSPGGALYAYDFASNIPGNKRLESDGSVSMTIQDGYLFHFFPVTHATIPASDVGAVFTTCQARLIKDNPTGPDNIDSTLWVADVGCDFYPTGSTYPAPTPPATRPPAGTVNVAAGGGKFVYLSRNWKALSFYTGGTSAVINGGGTQFPAQAWTETMLSANPPPMDGMGSPSSGGGTGGGTPPTIQAIYSGSKFTTLIYDRHISRATLATTPFTLKVNGVTTTISTAIASENRVILTHWGTSVINNQTVTVDYNGTTIISAADGTPAAAFIGHAAITGPATLNTVPQSQPQDNPYTVGYPTYLYRGSTAIGKVPLILVTLHDHAHASELKTEMIQICDKYGLATVIIDANDGNLLSTDTPYQYSGHSTWLQGIIPSWVTTLNADINWVYQVGWSAGSSYSLFNALNFTKATSYIRGIAVTAATLQTADPVQPYFRDVPCPFIIMWGSLDTSWYFTGRTGNYSMAQTTSFFQGFNGSTGSTALTSNTAPLAIQYYDNWVQSQVLTNGTHYWPGDPYTGSIHPEDTSFKFSDQIAQWILAQFILGTIP